MNKHPFWQAFDSDSNAVAVTTMMAPDAEFYAPMLTRPVRGVDEVATALKAIRRVLGPIDHEFELQDASQHFVMWRSKINGFLLQGVLVIVEDDEGKIVQLRMLLRPWPVSSLFVAGVRPLLDDVFPDEYWELAPKPARREPREFTPLALTSIPAAKDIVLHSPMLAKSVAGDKAVLEAVGYAHQVQSESSYTSIIATPRLLFELFDCDANGYPMEGVWIQKLNSEGQRSDLTVYLRPYAAVTVLRNETRDLAKADGGIIADEEFWVLPSHS